jgi:hypothetical protein
MQSGFIRGRNPAVECRGGHAEVAGDVPWRHSAGEWLLGRPNSAFRHLPLPGAFATELACDIEAGAGSFDREFSFHLSRGLWRTVPDKAKLI